MSTFGVRIEATNVKTDCEGEPHILQDAELHHMLKSMGPYG